MTYRMLTAWLVVIAIAGCDKGNVQPKQTNPPASTTVIVAKLPASIQSRGRLRVGVKCDSPPFGYIGASGTPTGYEVDIAHQLATYAFGKPDALDLECVKSADRIPYLTTNRIDIIIATLGYNDDRAKVIKFSKPYFSSDVRTLVKKGSGIDRVTDLKGKTVVHEKGSPVGTWFKKCLPEVQTVEYDTSSQSVTAVRQGRADAWATDGSVLANIAEKDKTLTVSGFAYSAIWGMATSKDESELSAWLDAAIDKMQAEDLFWKNFQTLYESDELRQLFIKSVPRPGQSINYLASADILKCP